MLPIAEVLPPRTCSHPSMVVVVVQDFWFYDMHGAYPDDHEQVQEIRTLLLRRKCEKKGKRRFRGKCVRVCVCFVWTFWRLKRWNYNQRIFYFLTVFVFCEKVQNTDLCFAFGPLFVLTLDCWRSANTKSVVLQFHRSSAKCEAFSTFRCFASQFWGRTCLKMCQTFDADLSVNQSASRPSVRLYVIKRQVWSEYAIRCQLYCKITTLAKPCAACCVGRQDTIENTEHGDY